MYVTLKLNWLVDPHISHGVELTRNSQLKLVKLRPTEFLREYVPCIAGGESDILARDGCVLRLVVFVAVLRLVVFVAVG